MLNSKKKISKSKREYNQALRESKGRKKKELLPQTSLDKGTRRILAQDKSANSCEQQGEAVPKGQQTTRPNPENSSTVLYPAPWCPS